MSDLPTKTKALVLLKSNKGSTSDNQGLLYDARVLDRDIPVLKSGEVLVQIVAAAFNHRELWQRKNLYPNIADNSVMGGDGAGIVIASFDGVDDALVGRRVFLVPTRGWKSDPRGPEERFATVGGAAYPPIGTFSEYVVVERDQVIEIPAHLDFEHAAAWPIVGVTAWRATVVKGQVCAGYNILIVGIGGGVALTCLQLCVALGANVYVTSGDQTKIDKAVELGARGGVNYKSENWPGQLAELLKRDSPRSETGNTQPLLDVVFDQAGGDIMKKTSKIMRAGGVVVCYGMHVVPQIPFYMMDVLKNAELKGSTLGSKLDLENATTFIAKHNISPIVAQVIDDLEQGSQEGFELLEKGTHMGKIVVRMRGGSPDTLKASL